MHKQPAIGRSQGNKFDFVPKLKWLYFYYMVLSVCQNTNLFGFGTKARNEHTVCSRAVYVEIRFGSGAKTKSEGSRLGSTQMKRQQQTKEFVFSLYV